MGIVVALTDQTNRGVLEGTVKHCRELTVNFLRGGLARVAFSFIHCRDANRHFSGNERLIEINAFPVTAPVIETHGSAVAFPIRISLRWDYVHCTRGGA